MGCAKAAKLLAVVTLFNLVGAIIVAAPFATTSKFSGMDSAHLLATVSDTKLTKAPLQQFSEAIVANFIVNMGVVIALFTKDLTSRIVAILTTITVFVALGLEHVITNFCLFALVFFSMDESLVSLSASSVAINWTVAFAGNSVGGGLFSAGCTLGCIAGSTLYRD